MTTTPEQLAAGIAASLGKAKTKGHTLVGGASGLAEYATSLGADLTQLEQLLVEAYPYLVAAQPPPPPPDPVEPEPEPDPPDPPDPPPPPLPDERPVYRFPNMPAGTSTTAFFLNGYGDEFEFGVHDIDAARPKGASHGIFLGSQDDRHPWWWSRVYNAFGVIIGTELRRMGSFEPGKMHEGHGLYGNVHRSLLVEELVGYDIGGQLVQIVWRGGVPAGVWGGEMQNPETRLPDIYGWSDSGYLPKGGGTLEFTDCHVTNPGLIAARASNPFSIFNPGHEIVRLQRCGVTKIAHPTSQGFFLHRPGKWARFYRAGDVAGSKTGGYDPALFQADLVELIDSQVQLANSDRAASHIGNAKLARIAGGDWLVSGGPLVFNFEDTCDAVFVDIDTAYTVRILDADNILGQPLETIQRTRQDPPFEWSR